MFPRFAIALCLVLLSLGFVVALPSPQRLAPSAVIPAALATPTSITTTNTIQTAKGPVTETCVLTFTPDGHQIQEVQNCTMSMGGSEVTSTLVTPSGSPAVINVAPDTTVTSTSTASSSPTAVAAFIMPGRSLEVLPIGLGVFGGITAIAVFVVAFVTWERVKYRRTFRQRRLVEQTRPMGNGGMSKG
ncbi:hypothetical protein PAXINDRAFT_90881 [Paxillus involutus ATCC 200175]|uniref:Uncharacterized protein n=1 Tax=Paxillus involutus ATCC 200175 TaxID=664439 RepID=A0A0C9SWH8_PAXIN|nr:hypothetical protein PAXINDRAFT_90881 [Paxillus involutus ATCC 200175]